MWRRLRPFDRGVQLLLLNQLTVNIGFSMLMGQRVVRRLGDRRHRRAVAHHRLGAPPLERPVGHNLRPHTHGHGFCALGAE
jgi:hypothetical protein